MSKRSESLADIHNFSVHADDTHKYLISFEFHNDAQLSMCNRQLEIVCFSVVAAVDLAEMSFASVMFCSFHFVFRLIFPHFYFIFFL